MARGDGRLSHDLNPGEKGPQDACGVFGVWAPGEEVAKLAYYGLYALQHRGQESAGIAVGNGEQILVYKDMGLVSQVFDETALEALTGHIAVGHCRYSTTGGSTWENAQPTLGATAGGTVALGHNGNLTNTHELRDLVAKRYGEAARGELARGNTTDTALVTALLAGDPDHTLEATAMEVLPHLKGAFCFTFMDEDTLYAARDPHGVRPLVLGRLDRGWVVASETAALDIVGAAFVREVEPGELVVIDADGLRSRRFAPATPTGCVFEYVYLARPDTTINGRVLHEARVEMGRSLAREHPVEADLVIPVPESGTPAAIGYAQQSGIPYGQGLVKNAYVGRTFIQPSQTIRQLGIRLKLNPLREVIRGKRLVVVDDSIVRGNTQRALVRMLREAGAAEVHVRISSAPVTWPCFYGIDFPTRAELIATGLGTEEIRVLLGADSLGYISLDGMIGATEQPRERLCTACFTGTYPIELPASAHLGKHGLEQDELPLELPRRLDSRRDVEGVSTGLSGGAADALTRPLTSPRYPGGVPETDAPTGLTYAAAGVDVEAGDRAVALMKASVARTHGPEVLGGIGGFAGLFDASALKGYTRPLLASSTDGVGTKVAIAQALDVHDTIGHDLVGMVVDDIVVCGARPLFMTDYIACGRVVPERIAAIVRGIAAACELAGCALVGGETAEHPGLLGPEEYDVAGAATGVVEAAAVLGPARVRTGDVLVAMASTGLHSNGYSLVRRVLRHAGWGLERHVDELGRTVGEELLVPTRVYAKPVLELAVTLGDGLHAVSHVTGGGLAANLARVLPPGTLGLADRTSWTPAPVFGLIAGLGDVPRDDLERTLNLGVGMVAVLDPAAADRAVGLLEAAGVPAWTLGSVRDDDGRTGDVARGSKGVDGGAAQLVGRHPG